MAPALTPMADRPNSESSATEIAGYRYGGETVCPDCTKDIFIPFHLAGDAEVSTEEVLNSVAKRWGLNRDKDSFSSYDFAHRIYRPDVASGDICYVCGLPL